MAFFRESADRRINAGAVFEGRCFQPRHESCENKCGFSRGFSGARLKRTRLPPGVQIDRAHYHAEYIGGNESQLICFEADNAHNNTIDAG